MDCTRPGSGIEARLWGQATLRFLHDGVVMTKKVQLVTPHRLIPVHIKGEPPPYYIIGGLVFTQVNSIFLFFTFSSFFTSLTSPFLISSFCWSFCSVFPPRL